VEQFGTPEEVYNRPASTFVASFMGAPPMNLLAKVPDVPAGRVLGVRPEHMHILPASDGTGWLGQVEALEMLGAERLVYVRVEDEPLIVRIDEGTPPPAVGATVRVSARADRLHWFNAQTGLRVADGTDA